MANEFDTFLETFDNVSFRPLTSVQIVSSANPGTDMIDIEPVFLTSLGLDLGMICPFCMANFSCHVEGDADPKAMMVEVRADYQKHLREDHGLTTDADG